MKFSTIAVTYIRLLNVVPPAVDVCMLWGDDEGKRERGRGVGGGVAKGVVNALVETSRQQDEQPNEI